MGAMRRPYLNPITKLEKVLVARVFNGTVVITTFEVIDHM